MKTYKIWWKHKEYIIESDSYLHAKIKLADRLEVSHDKMIATAPILVMCDGKWQLIGADD